MSAPSKASLQELPRELRDLILDHLLSNPVWKGNIRIKPDCSTSNLAKRKRLTSMEMLDTSILRVNHQFSSEALAAIFQRQCFSFLCNPTRILKFLKNLSPQARDLIAHIRLTAFSANAPFINSSKGTNSIAPEHFETHLSELRASWESGTNQLLDYARSSTGIRKLTVPLMPSNSFTSRKDNQFDFHAYQLLVTTAAALRSLLLEGLQELQIHYYGFYTATIRRLLSETQDPRHLLHVILGHETSTTRLTCRSRSGVAALEAELQKQYEGVSLADLVVGVTEAPDDFGSMLFTLRKPLKMHFEVLTEETRALRLTRQVVAELPKVDRRWVLGSSKGVEAVRADGVADAVVMDVQASTVPATVTMMKTTTAMAVGVA